MISRLAHAPLTYILLIIFAGLFVYSAFGAYKKSLAAKKKMVAASEEMAELIAQKDKLSAELHNANTSFGQEKAIREKFNVVKEGERVIMVVKEDPTDGEDMGDEGLGFWQFLKGLFSRD